MSIRKVWQKAVYLSSFEWLITGERSNGGDVVLGRSLGIAALICAVTLALRNLIDPKLGNVPSLDEFRGQVLEIAPWFAGAVGAVYAALYARFSSQWSYLAQLYNQIKQTEIELICAGSQNEDDAAKKLTEWKAGFIEDADDLHLHAKENVAAIIFFWGKDPKVERCFVDASAGGVNRWNRIYSEATAAHSAAISKHTS